MLFERRDIERKVIVYRVEAESAAQAEDIYTNEDPAPVDEYYIDSELAVDWTTNLLP